MSRLIRWAKATVRFWLRLGILVYRIASGTAAFLPNAVWRMIRGLILEELVWRRRLGYGERPFNVLLVIALALLATWLLYWQVGTFVLDSSVSPPETGNPTWQGALYFSLASLTALGYGSWVSEPLGWVQWVAAVEPFVGIISAVALSVTLTQRMNR